MPKYIQVKLPLAEFLSVKKIYEIKHSCNVNSNPITHLIKTFPSRERLQID